MISKKVEKELNKQINAELYSAYLYLSMSAYASSLNLNGFANWLRIQFQEEQAHALLLYDYLIERGGNIVLEQIEKPQTKWKNIIDIFNEVLKHEEKVTSLINNLASVAISEKDHATNSKLQWFINEQVEEEASVNDVLNQLKMIEGKGSGLFMLDRELKQRVFIPIVTTNKI